MRVNRLEIFGFKSFMERLVLPLDGGITGVVGPNGCGKSNVVDAIRWVLGETRAKHLRGEVLEDIIFNGTENLRPLGLAEVTLTLRASGANFFEDIKQVSELEEEIAEIVQSIAEEGVDEGIEEGQESATENVENIIEDSRPQLTVIEGNLGKERAGSENQPEPQQIISEERCEILPETEKIETSTEISSAQDSSVEAAESQPKQGSSVATLSSRFAWLRNVNEVQVTRRLYRSGESEFFINRVPCRLKDLRELFRATGIGARSHTIVAQGEVGRIVTAKPEERRLVLEEAAGVLGFRDKIAAASRKLEETNLNIARIEDIIREVSRQVAILKRQAARAQNRQELKDRVCELEEQIARDHAIEIAQNIAKFSAEMEHLSQAESGAQAHLQRLQAEEHEIRNQLMSIDVEGDAIRLRIDSIREEISNRARQEGQKRGRLSELQALIISGQNQIQKLSEQFTTFNERRNQNQIALTALTEELTRLTDSRAALVEGGDSELSEIANSLIQAREEVTRKAKEHRQVREEVIATQSSLDVINSEIQAASPLRALQKTQESADIKGRLLVEGLKVPEKYTRAVQAVLGEKAGFVVLEDPHAFAKLLVSQDSGDNQGRTLGAFRSGSAPIISRKFNLPFPELLTVIEIDSGFEQAAAKLLAHVFIAENLTEALTYFSRREADDQGFAIVTVEGEILTPDSFYKFSHDGGLVQLMRRAEDASERLQSLLAHQVEAETHLLRAQEQLKEREARQEQLLAEKSKRQAELERISGEMGSVRGKHDTEQRLARELAEDLQTIETQQRDLFAKIEQYKSEREEVNQILLDTLPSDEGALKAEVEELSQQYSALDLSRKDSRERLGSMSSDTEEARATLDQAREELSDLHLALQKCDLEQANLRDRLSADYGSELCERVFSVESTEARLDSALLIEFKEEVQKLKARIVREGDVDPSSIERYAEENQRYEELTRQRNDLTEAATTLRRTIDKLTETSKQRFLSVFAAVKNNFSKLIPRLFGGGRGSLELLDPSKPLDSGVEILIRPPGKKLKNIDLLSGGEKALTATALVFAMFMERPSPLCVLDEVDAPLDEANLMRFLSMIREMSSRTQFLVITHNKQSMALADHLVGVTMQQPGASKVISVSLNEAMAQVA